MIRSAGKCLLALSLIGMTGCADLPFNRPPPQLFVLSPKSTYDKTLPKVTWQLSVDTPIAEAGLNTSRIAVRRSPVRLNYFEGVNWSDIAPRMVQTLIVESFENSKGIVGVGRQNTALRSDYMLVSELREFQAETLEGGWPKIRVRVNAKLIRLPQRVIVDGTTRESVVVADGESMEEVVTAFDEALGNVLKKLVTWTLRAGQKDFETRRRR